MGALGTRDHIARPDPPHSTLRVGGGGGSGLGPMAPAAGGAYPLAQATQAIAVGIAANRAAGMSQPQLVHTP